MAKPRLFRRRYLPDELVELKDDEIIDFDDEKLLTRWTVLKPRNDFVRGVSCYYLKKGLKISRFIDAGGKCIYIYCDIIETLYDGDSNVYTFNDLLADVIIYEDGRVVVADLAEISEALDMDLITVEQAKSALRKLDMLLQIIYGGRLDEYIPSNCQ